MVVQIKGEQLFIIESNVKLTFRMTEKSNGKGKIIDIYYYFKQYSLCSVPISGLQQVFILNRRNIKHARWRVLRSGADTLY